MLQQVLLWDIGADAAKTGASTENLTSNLSSSLNLPVGMDLVQNNPVPVMPDNNLVAAVAAPADPNAAPVAKVNEIAQAIVASIHNLSKGLARAFQGQHRRRDEKTVCKAAENAATVLTGYLLWEPKHGTDIERAIYYTNAINQIKSLLIDGNALP